ncbi:hypothetical protein ES288_A13G123400v1 [Gossypium darwinii]|uniref:ATP-dependent DNA helicase n=1 Tax=Gossypium darwinii TaxID=34276 RepID=A0A5D2DYV9_GOSDA|nr:hypothetical protein ES288_A13G123400v1 [Gossypium darwinii]
MMNCTKDLIVTRKPIYNAIVNYIYNWFGGFFFVYGSDGTRKTFLYTQLFLNLDLKKKYYYFASSRIASLFFPCGRIAHSNFKIILKLDKDSCCDVKKGSPLAKLLNKSSL